MDPEQTSNLELLLDIARERLQSARDRIQKTQHLAAMLLTVSGLVFLLIGVLLQVAFSQGIDPVAQPWDAVMVAFLVVPMVICVIVIRLVLAAIHDPSPELELPFVSMARSRHDEDRYSPADVAEQDRGVLLSYTIDEIAFVADRTFHENEVSQAILADSSLWLRRAIFLTGISLVMFSTYFMMRPAI